MKNLKLYGSDKIIKILLSSTIILYAAGCQKDATILEQPINNINKNNITEINESQKKIENLKNELDLMEQKLHSIEQNLNNIKNNQKKTTTIEIQKEKNDEQDVLNHFKQIDTKFKTNDHHSSPSVKNELKKDFTDTIDFIFFEEEINGFKFKHLSKEVQGAIVEIFLTIDNTIDYIEPGYKDSLSKGYQSVIRSIKTIKNNTKEKIEEKVEEKEQTENYERLIDIAKENWDDTVDTAKGYLDFSTEVGSKAKSKIKNWYQDLKK